MPSLALHSIEDAVPMAFCASFLLWDVDAFSHWGMFQDVRVNFDQLTHLLWGNGFGMIEARLCQGPVVKSIRVARYFGTQIATSLNERTWLCHVVPNDMQRNS